VNTITETGICHWPRRRGERTCGGEYDCDALDRRIDTRGVAKIKRWCAQTERLGDPLDFIKIASGQDWARSPIARRLCDESPGLAGRSIDQDRSVQGARLDDRLTAMRCHTPLRLSPGSIVAVKITTPLAALSLARLLALTEAP
jgi:hypothetical protein